MDIPTAERVADARDAGLVRGRRIPETVAARQAADLATGADGPGRSHPHGVAAPSRRMNVPLSATSMSGR